MQDIMNAELIKEILRRVEAKYTATTDNVNPCAWVELHSDESWEVRIQDDQAYEHSMHSGKGWETITNLLAELRGK